MIDLSVLMPVYNASHYPDGWVERALNSVLWYQPEIEVEVCIGDDGSNDGYLEKLLDERIRIVRAGDEPTGGSRAANAAATIAQGRYFIILSCRSWYQARSLTAMVNYLDNSPEIGFVYGDTMKYLPNGRAIYKQAAPYNPKLFMTSFPTSFGYMYRRGAFDNGARYGCDVYAEQEKRWLTIGDHYMLAQLVQDKWRGFAMRNLMVLHYQYGEVQQSTDLLSKYKGKLNGRLRLLLSQRSADV
jgi:glycosyltransferase involved in cell wall biosynthesis